MPALIEVTGTFPAYQVTVRGTLLEILDVTVDPERIGPRRPVGIASDTGAHLIYLDGDQWVGHLGIVAAPEALPSGRLSVGATYDDSLGNRRRWDGTAWRALGGLSLLPDGTLVSSGPIVVPTISPNAGPRRIIIEGDSISCDASSCSGGWANLFSILSRGEYIIAYNDAIGGTTLPQMAARFGSIPSYVEADEVHLQGGTTSPGITTANKDALESLRVQILARGAVPVIHSIPPLYNDPSAMDWNVYLQQWCNKYGFRFIDKWAGIINPFSGRISDTFLYANDATYVHPNAAGHLVAAKKCLDLLRPGSGTGTTPYSLIVDKSTNKGIGLSSNALFSANTGGLATGWDAQLSGSGVTSTPTIVDLTPPWVGKGQRWQDTMTADGANYYRHTKTIAVPAGHRVRIVYGYFKLTGFTEDAPNKFTMQVRMSTNLGPVSEQLTRIPAIAVEGSLVREYVMPAGGTSLILEIACYGGLSVDYTIGQVQVYDLTALELD